MVAILSSLLAGHSKGEAAVSHSTAEAEIIAAERALGVEGLLALFLWCKLFDRWPLLDVYQASQVTARMIFYGSCASAAPY